VIDEIAALEARWAEARGPGATALRAWASAILQAARTSLACGLSTQARLLLDKAAARLPVGGQGPRRLELGATWNPKDLPVRPSARREEAQWRRIRSLRSARRPYDGSQHPGRQGLAWGPYNRASAVVEALENAARRDALWVDDFLERERATGAIDRLLGCAG
jgi:hypothetical protein